MLYLKLPPVEAYDENKEEFVEIAPAITLQLEHSLLSMAKWESKWCKPFMAKGTKTYEEMVDYIRCMTINKVDKKVYDRLTKTHMEAIKEYMEHPHTATKFSNNKNKRSYYTPTTEDLYYSMFYYGAPIECEKWHINRLLALLEIAGRKNAPVKKKTARELNREYAELNALRLAQTGSKG